LRKQGRGIDELDFDTLRSWTFGYRPVGVRTNSEIKNTIVKLS
jgi:hypothetical protein